MTQYQKISRKIDYLERIDLESPMGIETSRWCSNYLGIQVEENYARRDGGTLRTYD